MSYIPVQFNNIYGDFGCDNNLLTSLKGGPKYVERDFYCIYNKLKTLEYCPKYIGRELYCITGNKLSNIDELYPSFDLQNLDEITNKNIHLC